MRYSNNVSGIAHHDHQINGKERSIHRPIPGRRRKPGADCTPRAPDYADEAIFGRRKSTNMNYATSRG